MPFAAPTGNVTSMSDVFVYFNSALSNFFVPAIIIAIFFIIIIRLAYNSDDISRPFAAASFIAMILTIFFRVFNLVNTRFMIIFIILTAVSLVWLYIDNSRRGY